MKNLHWQFDRQVHPLALKKEIPFSELQHLRMVMFAPDHQIRQLITRYCLQEGFSLDPQIETTTLSSLLSLVIQGIGACILPRLLLENLDHDEIAIISLINPTPSQDICIIYRSDRFMGFAARTFINTLHAYIEEAKKIE